MKEKIKMVRCKKFWSANRTAPSNRAGKLHRTANILQFFFAAPRLHRKSINFSTEQIYRQKIIRYKNKGLHRKSINFGTEQIFRQKNY